MLWKNISGHLPLPSHQFPHPGAFQLPSGLALPPFSYQSDFLTNQMQLYPIPAFVLVVDVSGELHSAEIPLAVTPGQIVNPDGEVLVPGVAKQFVLVFVADSSLTELAGTLAGALEHYGAVVRFLDPPNGSEGPVKGFVRVCEGTGQNDHLPELPGNIRWDVDGPAIGLHTCKQKEMKADLSAVFKRDIGHPFCICSVVGQKMDTLGPTKDSSLCRGLAGDY